MSPVQPAFRSYQDLDPEAPEGDALNLAWTRDERACLAVDLGAVLAAELRDEAEAELPFLGRYLVRDPYGEAALGPAVAAAFDLPAWRGHVTCGAGVVSLLHGLARLAPAVDVLGDTYPDFPYWVAQHGGTCAASSGSSSSGAALWFLERPGLTGEAFAALPALAELCAAASRRGAVVLVDESNANYYPPAWSAVRLAATLDNLAVLRGFSKAYGLGGLRLAYCVAAPALTERLRAALPPLLPSSLSLRLGARVLSLGDLAAPLRDRLAAHKREALELLTRAGVAGLVAASEHLPYLLSSADRDHLRARLEARGVTGKLHPFWSAATASPAQLYRLSVPLDEARMARLRQLLG